MHIGAVHESHFLLSSLDSIPNRPLSQWHTAVATFTYYCFNEMSVLFSLCVCVYMWMCLRKKHVSDPCGPVYLHPCVEVVGGQRQGCLYSSPFPRLLYCKRSGHRRMKRLWIFLPPILLTLTRAGRLVRRWVFIQSSFKPKTQNMWPELCGSRCFL